MLQSACTWKNLPLNVAGTICISLMAIVCTPLSLQSSGEHCVDINCVVIQLTVIQYVEIWRSSWKWCYIFLALFEVMCAWSQECESISEIVRCGSYPQIVFELAGFSL